MADAIVEYLTKPELRERHGANARERAITMFRGEAIWTVIANEYDELSKSRGVKACTYDEDIATLRDQRAAAQIHGLFE